MSNIKRRLPFFALMLLATVAMSGCLDLFAVPGVAISPDGSTLYFLSAPGFLGEDVSGDSLFFSSAAFGGTATTIMEGIGSFAVNPVNGTVAFSSGLEQGENAVSFIARYVDGEAALFIGPEAFGGFNFVATHMAYSPDGSTLAMAGIRFPGDASLDTLDMENLTPEDIALFDSVVYLVNDAGQVTLISDPEAQWPNTITWSPSSQYLAYNAWTDGNGDGVISTIGGLGSFADPTSGGFGLESDESMIFIYDTSSGQTSQANTNGTAYAPAFVSDTKLAFAEVDITLMMAGPGGEIKTWDIAAQAKESVYQTDGFIMGIALSPDGSRVAWTQLGQENAEGNTPSQLYTASPDFSNAAMLTDLGTDFFLVDVPVWMPDSSGILISSTNFLSTFVGAFAGALTSGFGDIAEEAGGEPIPTEEIPTQRVMLVDANTGSSQVVYTGVMMNGNFFASIIGLVGSGDMSSMFGDLGAPQ